MLSPSTPTYIPLPGLSSPAQKTPKPTITDSSQVKTTTTAVITQDMNQKAAVGAIIVVISIVAVIVISVVTWYFVQDPWEAAQSEDSSLNKDYFKNQESFYSWSEMHQSPYVLMHLFAPTGNILHLKHNITSWMAHPTPVSSEKHYAPIFELHLNHASNLIGLSRLRKKGVYLTTADILAKWKREHFFPDYNITSLDRMQPDAKQIPDSVTSELALGENMTSQPLALISFLYQPGEVSSERRVSCYAKILGWEANPSSDPQSKCVLYLNIVLENQDTREFFLQLMQKIPHSLDIYHAFRLEVYVYNPQWSSLVFPESMDKVFRVL